MMTILKERSIAEDSTLSTSPPLLRRATRTYGRAKATHPEQDLIPDTSENFTSRSNLYRTGPADVLEEIPETSDAPLSASNEEDEPTESSPKFNWSWREKLWNIDHADGIDDDNDDTHASASSSAPDSELEPLKKSEYSRPPNSSDVTRITATRPGPNPDVFGHDQPSQVSPSSPEEPPPSSLRYRLGKPSDVIDDSDSDQDRSRSSPVFTSPPFPHPINTPKSRSSTPPTSDANDEHVTRPPKKKRAAWKGKAKDVSQDTSDEMSSDSNDRSTSRKLSTRHRKGSKKKDLENARERSRAAAAQSVSIPRLEEHKYTLQSLWKSINPPTAPSSDPIQPFSSSSPGPPPEETMSIQENVFLHDKKSTLLRQPSDVPSLVPDSDSDEALPEVSALLNDMGQKQAEPDRAKELAEIKKRALAKQAQQKDLGLADDSEDDLEIVDNMKLVAEEENGQRKAMKARKARLSEGRKRQMALARVNVAHGHRSPTIKKYGDPLEQLKAIAQPSFGVSSRDKYGKGAQTKEKLTQSNLNAILVKRVNNVNSDINQAKYDDWVKRGGSVGEQLRQEDRGSKGRESAWKFYVEKGLKAAAAKKRPKDESHEQSAGPSRNESDDGLDKDESGEIPSDEGNVETIEKQDSEHDENDQEGPRAPRRSAARARAIQDSDEDDDAEDGPVSRISASVQGSVPPFTVGGMAPPRRVPQILHRPSVSSFEEPTEDETDKENNKRLMYDKSEDKENKAVVRHSPGGMIGRGEPLSAGASVKSSNKSFSFSPGSALSGDDGDISRTPFKDLLDDPFTSPTLPDAIPFATRLQQSVISSPSFAPRPVSLGTAGSGFSQFLDDNENHRDVPLLEAPKMGGLSQAFEFGTEPVNSLTLVKPNGSNPQRPTADIHRPQLDHFQRNDNLDDLSLTLDVHLQPSLKVSENFQQHADIIFEKEQAFLLEAARPKPVRKETLYVNDHGFLTQTRPEDVSSPEIYRIASPPSTQRSGPLHSQTPSLDVLQSLTRHPLRTLSFSHELVTPSRATDSSPAPLARLKRRSMSPLGGNGYRSSPSPSPPKRNLNAFELLARGQAKAEKRAKRQEQLGKSDFVETEAQESDEDERFGFGALKKMTEGEDEEDGAHLDQLLEALVDDAKMDVETEAVDLVLEKAKEHQEEDDRALEKYHRDAVEGKYRIKRRNRGLDMEDSDEEEDDDERAKRIRRQMYKKRKIGEDIETLGKNEETRAFYEAYQRDLVDDDPMDFGQPEEEETVAGTEDTQETVTTTEIHERIREMAQSEETYVATNDVSWLDKDSDDEAHPGFLIKEVAPAKKVTVLPRNASGLIDFDHDLKRPKRMAETETEKVRLASWAKAENRSRNFGMARSAAGSSVTGHGRAKVKAGAGSTRTGPQGLGRSAPERVEDGRTIRKTSSVLAGIADRTERFEQC